MKFKLQFSQVTMTVSYCLLLVTLLPFVGASQHFDLADDTPFFGVSAGASAFADIDNDGDNDLIISGNRRVSSLPQSQNYTSILYKNDGEGVFTEVSGTPFLGLEQVALAFADVDGDQDQDLLITGLDFTFDPHTDLYLNDGNGNFNRVTSSPFVNVYAGDIAFLDVDNDDDLDVLVSGSTVAFQAVSNTTLYINDGNGGYTAVANTPFVNVQESEFGISDIDADGDLDVIILGTSEVPGPVTEVYKNEGNGNYAVASEYEFAQLSSGELNFADIDNDGDEDLLIAGTTDGGLTPYTRLYINEGMGIFTENNSSALPDMKFVSSVFSDFDNDGDVDLLMSGKTSDDPNLFLAEGKETALFMNDGTGDFVTVESTVFTNVDLGHLSIADVNGDDLDDVLLVGNSDQGVTFHSELYLNASLVSSTDPSIIAESIAVYPNPSHTGVLHISATDADLGLAKVVIVDMLGKVVEAIEVTKGATTIRLDVSALRSGTYSMVLHSASTIFTRKISILN